MGIDEILKLPPDKIYPELTKKPKAAVSFKDILSQYDPNFHVVMDPAIRPKKEIKKAIKDANGNPIKDAVTGRPVVQTDYQEVNRIPVPFQMIIVERAVGFTFGHPVRYQNNAESVSQKKLYGMIDKTFRDNKLSFFNRKLGRKIFKECEAAELWYIEEAPEGYWGTKSKASLRLKVRLLAPSLGDNLYPHFDEYGDMDAFSREYSSFDEKGEKIILFDTYTNTDIWKFQYKDGKLLFLKNETLIFGKIPVVYYKQEYPEWYFVQKMIERFENFFSNYGDSNDYFASPIVFTIGKILGFPDKGEQGKVIQGDAGSDAKYLDWSNAPEAAKLEFETLIQLIYSMTQTPDISFDKLKNMGDLPGITLKTMLIDPHMKVENKIELFGEMFERRCNLVKTIIGKLIDITLSGDVNTLEITPVIIPYMPRNVKEEVEILSTATSGKAVLSRQTALEHFSLVSDPEKEMELLELELEEELASRRKEFSGTLEL